MAMPYNPYSSLTNTMFPSMPFPLNDLLYDDELEHFALMYALLFEEYEEDEGDEDDEGGEEHGGDEDDEEDGDEEHDEEFDDEFAEEFEEEEDEKADSDQECTKKPLDLTWLFKLPDNELRQATRMSKSSFLWIFNQIKDNAIFRRPGTPQLSIAQQLALTLELLGSNGHDGLPGPLASRLGISRRDAIKVIVGPVQAINALSHTYVTWPNEIRRQLISDVMKLEGFEGCVGSVDDLTIPLSYPMNDKSFLHSQTGRPTMNAQIICDANKRITAFFTGTPGEWRGSLTYEKSSLHRNPTKFFDPGQYLIADSAYRPSKTVIPPSNAPGPKSKTDEEFDYCLAKSHTRSQKAIGALKARWASLNEIRFSRTASAKHYIHWVHCCIVLHNMLNQFGDIWDEVDDHPTSPQVTPPTVRNTRTLDSFRLTVKTKCIEVNRRLGVI
ncbi:hypothetical protein PTTG_04732 [Puccinia triticina 1-1 BBBD Race 1]|uniref:DDE Tnp4 domain-containing protein n=1 Tax=Puccinia triticina (isolate 1-1 / race 1 (BBBD)) TaxID=630390 RepID=A0A180G8C4_PUCT1|nr:hypothetical protein PTTG_04732 [Puccinia triticina 1-1 BBBD Race 1]